MADKKFDKFLFNNDFFDISVVDNNGRPNHPPEIAELMNQAREEGYAEGHTDGVQKGVITAREEMAERIEILNNTIDQFDTLKAQYAADLQATAIATMRKILPMIAGDAAEKYSDELIASSLQKVLTQVGENTVLTLRLNPSTVQFYEDYKSENPKLFNDKNIKLQPDHSLAAGDCVAEWECGGVESSIESTLRELSELLHSANASKPDIDALSEMAVKASRTEADSEPENSPDSDENASPNGV